MTVIRFAALAAIVTVGSLPATPVFAQSDDVIAEVVTTGIRSAKPRSAADSTVPIDEIGPPNANRLSVGLQYARRSAANDEGRSWYLRGI